MKWRRKKEPAGGRRDETRPTAVPEPAFSASDVMLAETIARHFEGASVYGRTARLGDLDVEIECAVHDVRQMAGQHVAVLYFWISGRGLFDRPAFASVSGYHQAPEGAIIEGGCRWACTLAPVLRVVLAGEVPPEDVDVFESTIGQRRFRVVLSSLDRVMSSGHPGYETSQEVRRRLGGSPWLTPVVLSSGTLPILPATRTLLSVFVGETPVETTTEVKVNGGDWWPSNACFPKSPGPNEGPFTFMRELAVLTPLDPSEPPNRIDLEATLAGIGINAGEPWRAAGWMGWRAHGGRLAPPLLMGDLEPIEALTGRLPAAYRHFLTSVARSGAGPGYGLVEPAVDNDRILLAHAGCGVAWVLRLDASHSGEVWVDAAGSDKRYERVAASFDAWYRDWLDASIRASGPWIHWDAAYCATPGLISQYLDAVERETGQRPTDLSGRVKPGSITLTSGGTRIDPCHSCVLLVARFGLDQDVFTMGVFRGATEQGGHRSEGC